MISIIITTDPSSDKYLNRCVDSIAWQMSAEDELITVGANHMPATRVGRVISGHDSLSESRNIGVREARGDWIKFIDVDDVLAPFALNAFRSVRPSIPPDVAVVSGSQNKVHNGIVRASVPPPVVPEHIEKTNPIIVSQTFIRASDILSCGGFDSRIQFEEDWDLWLKFYRAGKRFATITAPVCYYWRDDSEQSAKVRDHTVEGMDVREYFRKTYNISPIR